MKKFVISVFLIGTLASVHALSFYGSEADGHLVYDKVDGLYRCLGSPVNCNKDDE